MTEILTGIIESEDPATQQREYKKLQKRISRSGRRVKELKEEAESKGAVFEGNSFKDLLEAVKVVYGDIKAELSDEPKTKAQDQGLRSDFTLSTDPGQIQQKAPEDKIEKFLKIAEKYAPMAEQFLTGLLARMQEKQGHRTQQQASAAPQAPEGWLSMNPLEKMVYEGTEWYSQGIAYDRFKAGQALGHSTQAPAPAMIPQQAPAALPQPQAPAAVPQPHPQPQAPEPEEAEYEETGDPEDQEDIIEKSELLNAMQEQNRTYIVMAVERIKSMEPQALLTELDKMECHLKKMKIYKPLIPISVKEMILHTTDQELLEFFAEHCPDHHAAIIEAKYEEKIKQGLEALQDLMRK